MFIDEGLLWYKILDIRNISHIIVVCCIPIIAIFITYLVQ